MDTIIRYPDYVTVETEEGVLAGQGREVVEKGDVRLDLQIRGNTLQVLCRAAGSGVRLIRLRWNTSFPEDTHYLGDAWERGYGDMEWHHLSAHRFMPWYFLAGRGMETAGYGVAVRPSAMCFWQVDSDGITLYLDVRCGGAGVKLNGRTLHAATVLHETYEGLDSFDAAVRFCRRMCSDPIFPPDPVYGGNNWYYAYGDSSERQILEDADYIAKLTEGIENRPFMIVDDCWQVNHRLGVDGYNGGPWRESNERFPDMRRLAAEIMDKGLRPGIWVRFLLNEDRRIPDAWRLPHNGCLDPSHPDALDYIKEDTKTICGWGYRLIKHDFSTYDVTGRWGFQMNPLVTHDGWHYYDETRTTAEIIVDFYRAILEAASDRSGTLILGCNTIGHLGAGLMHLNRTGDDTSGLEWERTRRMGINALAFRMPHHRTFYDVDADCVGITGAIDWHFNRQWSDLLAKSGTSLFLSVKPGILRPEQERELHELLRTASMVKAPAKPLGWRHTACPSAWETESGRQEYRWYEREGITLLKG